MSLAAAAAFAAALLLAAVSPGPGAMSVVSCAMGRGFLAAMAMAAGIVIGDLAYLSFAVLGLAALAQAMGGLFIAVKLAGAAYLVWLGVKLWRAEPALPGATDNRRRSFPGGIGAGLAVTLGNPKTIAFYVGFLPTFLDVTRLRILDFAALCTIVAVVVGTTMLAYAAAASRARRLLTSRRRVRAINRAAGTMMIGAGVTIAAR